MAEIQNNLVARANRTNECDLLQGYELQTLHFKSEGRILQSIPAPSQGWSHELIEGLSAPGVCWDAYLGNQWIGGSEI